MIRISVVVCTYNRANMLEGALDSLIQQTLDKDLYEIIVVDNASKDNTSHVVKEIHSRHADYSIVLMYEPILGLGHARNAGLKHAQGEFVAFMDDDARASPDWLQTAMRCFAEVEPTPVVVGGVIKPFYNSPKPGWFKDEYETRTWGLEPRFLRPGEVFSGSNMVLRKAAALSCGGFDVRVGVKGEILSLGEEVSLFWRIVANTGQAQPFYYDPQLVVFHEAPHYKMTVSYRLKRAFATGQALYIIEGHRSALGRVRLGSRLFKILASRLLSALGRVRAYEAHQNWMVESLGPVAVTLGRLTVCLGLHVSIRQK